MIDTSDHSAVKPTPGTELPLETWRRLYDLARRVRDMAPWQWMEETDLFAVRDSQSKEPLFVSVMGNQGAYYAVSVYPGAKALALFWQTQAVDDLIRNYDLMASLVLATPQAHVAFGAKKDLAPVEKEIIKTLGLSFKGRHSWPCFRGFRPGWHPWFVDSQEARWLELAMENVLEIAPRARQDRGLLRRDNLEAPYLTRIRVSDDPAGRWEEKLEVCPPPTFRIQVTAPAELFQRVQKLPDNGCRVEMDLVPFMVPVAFEGERPLQPYVLLVCDADSELVVGLDVMVCEREIEDLWQQVPAKFLDICDREKIRPAEVRLRAPWLAMVMEDLCKELGAQMRFTMDLPAVSGAMGELAGYLSPWNR